VLLLPVDINHSCWDNTLHENTGSRCSIRLGFRQVRGLREADMQLLVAGRQPMYTSIHALVDRGLPLSAIDKLCDADAFGSLGLARRQALWQIAALQDRPVALFAGQEAADSSEEKITLPLMTEAEQVVQDYASTALSLRAHPVSFVREKLQLLHIIPAAALAAGKDGDLVKVAGLVLVRQRPGTAKGVCFISIEDETGFANLVVFQKLFDLYRKEILQSKLLMVEGKLQREGEVIHVIVQQCFNLSKLLRGLTANGHQNSSLNTLSRADERSIPAHAEKSNKAAIQETIQKDIFHGGRNFK
jgi:error-prone DNA polymerase